MPAYEPFFAFQTHFFAARQCDAFVKSSQNIDFGFSFREIISTFVLRLGDENGSF